jgi:hypothetical protein
MRRILLLIGSTCVLFVACGGNSNTQKSESSTPTIKIGDTVAAAFPNSDWVFEVAEVTGIEGTRVTVKTHASYFNKGREEIKLTDMEFIHLDGAPLVNLSSLKVGDAVVFTNTVYEQLGVFVGGNVSSIEDGKVFITHTNPRTGFRMTKREMLELPPPTQISVPREALANRIKDRYK